MSISDQITDRLNNIHNDTADMISNMVISNVNDKMDEIEDDTAFIADTAKKDYPKHTDPNKLLDSFSGHDAVKDIGGDVYYRESIQYETGEFITSHAVETNIPDYRNETWYTSPKGDGEFFVSPFYKLNDADTDTVVTFSFPIRDGDVFIGVAAVDIKLSDIFNYFLSVNAKAVIDTVIISDKGEYIFGATDNADIKKAIIDNRSLISGELRSMEQEGNNTSDTWTLSGYEFSILDVDTADWGIMLAYNLINVDNESQQIANTVNLNTLDLVNSLRSNNSQLQIMVLILLVLSMLVGFFVTRRFSKKVTTPIIQIVDKINETEDGNLDIDFNDVKSGDEIEKIALAMGEMLASTRNHIKNVKLSTAEKERNAAELDIARTIQLSMLPSTFPAFPERADLSLYATMKPALEVGGDFYDFFFIDEDHIALIIADVSGKGVAAALFMAVSKTVLKNKVMGNFEPSSILEETNEALSDGNDAMMFATCFLVIVNVKTGEAKYSNAGHNPPLLVRRFPRGEKSIEYIEDAVSLPLGIKQGAKYTGSSFVMEKHDRLIMYTDGVTEAFNGAGNQYGLERLENFINSRPVTKLSLTNIDESLLRDIDSFTGDYPQSDDITMLLFSLCDEHSLQRIIVSPDISAVADIEKFLSRNLSNDHVNERDVGIIQLILEEIFVNIANYAYLDSERLKQIVKISYKCKDVDVETPSKKEVVLKIADYGREFDPTSATTPELNDDINAREIGGLGIFMSFELADSIEYTRESGKNVLVIKKLVDIT